MRADAHIHLFAGGFQGGPRKSQPPVTTDEPTTYDALASEHDIAAALVIGYAAENWCSQNNAYLVEQSQRFKWIRPLAYVDLASRISVQNVKLLQQQAFVGISVYVCVGDAARLAQIPESVWQWLEAQDWLVSANSQGEEWTAWEPILENTPQLKLLVSHLGQPPAAASPPSREQAAKSMRSVTKLSKYPGVRVKLSGFYSLTVRGDDFPHESAWPYVEQLMETFSSDRLLWGSDFSPCLESITFPQTIDVFDRMAFLTADDVAKITGTNLLALLK